ncbi:hypothetical protein [Synechococcus elongatus]|nr:hypothetical protein [Synechococcus elongatus]AJD58875.1 hypothetical protein M744_05540 [Synechococcus elongatus UTEX 2973]MBD2586915.1 hypothetical protein [Synechococcus elongatus FACHB-242]MBD2687986.1 hypothetical protein [Synechococcus elongatus FACHB-1061]MBD2706303.1 hypothetical protein [Synechococcus elongatus PCC 7942 = FACHB-805]UOW71989.1 hypothetical protein PCC7943_2247 [Synechococcus elongatus PCC 7943]
MSKQVVPPRAGWRSPRLWQLILFLQVMSCLALAYRYQSLQQAIATQQQQIQCLEARSLDTRADLSRCRR